MAEQGGKSFKMIANDVSEGFITINPIFLKPFSDPGIKNLYKAIEQKQIVVRTEPFPHNDVMKIRNRNMRLQRLHVSLLIIKNYARERKIQIF